jgi:hypothetical protein
MVLLSSSGFVVQKHFCQNKLKSVSIYLKPEQCHQPKAMAKSCPMHGAADKTHVQSPPKGCCDDSAELLKLDTKVLVSAQTDFSIPLVSLDFSTIPQTETSTELRTSKLHYLNYKPPLLVCDFSSRLQTFLC